MPATKTTPRENRITRIIVGTTLLLSLSGANAPADSPMPLDGLYRRAQRAYNRQDFETALPLLKDYIERSKDLPIKRERLLWVVDQVGRIYLRERRDPQAALDFFKGLAGHKRLSAAEYQVIGEWRSAAAEWVRNGALPDDLMSANALFERGTAFYNEGLSVKKFPADDAGDAYFHVAASFLVPFIVNYDRDPRIGEALLMMGVIRHNSRTDEEYWSSNFYLHEVIRRFPHTLLALRAYQLLERDVHLGYTGSSGDHTPASVLRLLKQYEQLAQPADEDAQDSQVTPD